MPEARGNFVYRNLANATSVLGVLPLVVLFLDDGYRYVVPLFLFNNFMDDFDGIVAAKLNIRSRFGATLGNVAKYNSRLLAICNYCAHTVELNLRQLIDRHGRSYPVPAIKKRLRCTRCKSDSCAVQVASQGHTFTALLKRSGCGSQSSVFNT